MQKKKTQNPKKSPQSKPLKKPARHFRTLQQAKSKWSDIAASQNKKVKEGKMKYDWPTLKQEYFESDYQEVKAFFLQKYGKFNSAMMHSTVGWPTEKRAWRNAEVQLSLQNLQSDRVAGLKETLDKIVALCRGEINTMAHKGV